MFSTGDEIKAHITSEKEVTIDDLLAEASTIWKKCRARGLVFSDNKEFLDSTEVLMNDMRKEHSEFCKSYPIVLRYMAQMQEYAPKAFKLYLMKIKEHPWKSEDEYLQSQADYVVLLFRATSKKRGTRCNQTQLSALRKNVYQMLKNESDIFKASAKAIEKEVDNDEKAAQQRKEGNLKHHYQTYGQECLNVRVRIESDVPTTPMVDIDKLAGIDNAPAGEQPVEPANSNHASASSPAPASALSSSSPASASPPAPTDSINADSLLE
jgi:hypothetical protein